MSWSIAEVARMSKVTSRTLRHYDAIGLLPASWTDHSGRRYYEHADLLRLQQILLLRDLGLKLETIKAVLEAQSEQDAAILLRKHREWLRNERKRLTRLIGTVDATIESLEKGGDMAPEKLFEGFDPSEFGGFEPEQHVAEARDRWGETVDEANARVKHWTKEDWSRFKEESEAGLSRIVQLFDEEVPADDPRTVEAIDAQYRMVANFWTPNREAFIGLGQMYVDDPRFAKTYEDVRPGLAAYMRDAMKVYAEQRLA